MQLIQNISQAREFIFHQKIVGKKIAFVPTMGALHSGHFSLIKKANDCAEIVIVSIFVNKTQFNNLNDYEKYPKNLEADLKVLANLKVDAVFAPNNEEIFNDNFSFKIIPTTLTDCLCGKSRPGHFEGVALIVTKLFNIIKPDYSIFGEKDFQQLTIIQRLVRDLNFDIKIIPCPTIRENEGLAMSSRNQRLSEIGKTKAQMIYKVLSQIRDSTDKTHKFIEQKKQELLQKGFEKIEYLEIRNEENLEILTTEELKSDKQKISARIFIACYIDGVRLIDNLKI